MEQVFADTKQSDVQSKTHSGNQSETRFIRPSAKNHEAGKDDAQFKDYCNLLYAQALLIEGIMPDDPAAVANKIAQLMAK